MKSIISIETHVFHRRYLRDQEELEDKLGIWDYWRETENMTMTRLTKKSRLAPDAFSEVGVFGMDGTPYRFLASAFDYFHPTQITTLL